VPAHIPGWAAAAVAFHGDGEFAAGQDREAPALGAGLQRHLGMAGRNRARFTFEIGAEIDHLIASLLHGQRRRIDRVAGRPISLKRVCAKIGSSGLQLSVARVVQRAANRVVDRQNCSW